MTNNTSNTNISSLLLTITIIICGFFMTCSSDNLQIFEGTSIIAKGLSHCNNEKPGKEVIKRYTKISKYNRTHHHIYCNFTLPFDLDENVTLDVDVKKKSSNGFVNVIRFNSILCHFVNRHFKNMMAEWFESGGYRFEKCPIPKGTYIWNTVLNVKVKNFPYVPNGEYESTVVLYRGVRHKKILCIKVLFQIISKISTQKNDTIFEITHDGY